MDPYEKLNCLEEAMSLLNRAIDGLQGNGFDDLIDSIRDAMADTDMAKRSLQDELHKENEAVREEQEREYYRAVY